MTITKGGRDVTTIRALDSSPGIVHEHDPIVLYDSIKCRLCGEPLESAEEVIASAQSIMRARRIQDEIAMEGQYMLTGLSDDGVIYSKPSDGIFTDVLIRKRRSRSFEVVKRYRRCNE